jgi:endonuclease/exonuclease/phosphatase family metal-dependent hydrolase
MADFTLCTFNANNLFARYRFGETFPGDRSFKSAAADGWGYLPLNTEGTIQIFNDAQRRLTAAALVRGKSSPKKADYPDILCLQEVESLLALRRFNEEYLEGVYDHALLVDGRDLRQIDVAVLSKRPLESVRSHVDDPHPKPTKHRPFLFSRDCLEVTVRLKASGAKRVTLFVNHLKSKYAESAAEREAGDELRRIQAEAVLDIVRRRFPGPSFTSELFAVVGDLNDEPQANTLKPLFSGSGLVDALARIAPEEDRWTHWFRSENSVSQLDHLLVSPALAAASTTPVIERRGIGFARILQDGKIGPRQTRFHRSDGDANPVAVGFQFKRFANVTPQEYASDHCPVFLGFSV